MKTLFRWILRALLILVLAGAAHYVFLSWQARTLSRSLGLGQGGASQLSLPGLASAIIPSLVPSLPRDVPSVLGASSASTARARDARYLVVNVGPERSEVVIDGIARGNTPYVGEIDCRHGSKIVITVLPPVGAPKAFERVCDRQEIRIVDEQE